MKCPLSITLIGALFIVSGSFGLVYHASELSGPGPVRPEAVWVLLLRLLAIIGGLYVLRAAGWARWLLIAWLAYHTIISTVHSVEQTVPHGLLLAVIGYLLVRQPAAAYFRTVR